jgi:hypothetical protein
MPDLWSLNGNYNKDNVIERKIVKYILHITKKLEGMQNMLEITWAMEVLMCIKYYIWHKY